MFRFHQQALQWPLRPTLWLRMQPLSGVQKIGGSILWVEYLPGDLSRGNLGGTHVCDKHRSPGTHPILGDQDPGRTRKGVGTWNTGHCQWDSDAFTWRHMGPDTQALGAIKSQFPEPIMHLPQNAPEKIRIQIHLFPRKDKGIEPSIQHPLCPAQCCAPASHHALLRFSPFKIKIDVCKNFWLFKSRNAHRTNPGQDKSHHCSVCVCMQAHTHAHTHS